MPRVEAQKRARGRPRKDTPKEKVTLRLDADVVDFFRADGAGWQTRLNSVLRSAIAKR